jgi:trehalose-6-phosphate synthase
MTSVFVISFRGVEKRPRAGGVGSFLDSLSNLLSKQSHLRFEGIFSVLEEHASGGLVSNSLIHSKPDAEILKLTQLSPGLVDAFYRRLNEEDWFENNPGVEHYADYGPQPKTATDSEDYLSQPRYACLNEYAVVISAPIIETIRSYKTEKNDLLVWVNDFQNWMLIPKLRRAFPAARIIYQHQTPMPRQIPAHRAPYYRQVLSAYTDADILLADMDSYLDSLMDLALELGTFKVDKENKNMRKHVDSVRTTRLVDACVSIDPDEWVQWAADDSNDAAIPAELQTIIHSGRFAIKADRISDPAKNGPLTFEAIELDFEQNPELVGNFTYVIIGPPNRCAIPIYAQTWKQCEELESRILKKFPTDKQPPICWIKEPIPRSALARLYASCNVQIVNSLADGLNFSPFEGTASRLNNFTQIRQKNQAVSDLGVIVLSNTIGAWEFLSSGVVPVNPRNKFDIANALNYARNLKLEDRVLLNALAVSAVWGYTVDDWFDRVTKELSDYAYAIR